MSVVEENPSKARRAPGSINIKYLNEITLADHLVSQARHAECVAPLTARHFTSSDVTDLENTAARLHETASKAVGRTTARDLGPAEELAARTRLLDALHPIRIGAKRSYRGEGKAAGRSPYYINEPLDVTLERLLFIAGVILQKLTPQPAPGGTGILPPEDTLKGVTQENLEELAAARAAFVGPDAESTLTCSEAAALRQQVESLLVETREKRIDLQLAADQAWPHTKPENAVIRRAFRLPENKPAHE